MKFLILLFTFLSFAIITAAQKKTYFLFACAQQITKDICAEKVLIKSTEIELTAAEAENYARNYQKELAQQYNAANKYKNLQVSLIPPGNTVIQFEGERKYMQQSDGWNCTSTFYGIVNGVDDAAAEKKLAALKKDFTRSTYEEMKRWGKSALGSLDDDLQIKWVQNKNGIILFLKNTGKGMALKLLVRSLTITTASPGDLEKEENFMKLTKTEEITIELQPGGSAQQNLKSADAFEIDITPVSATKEDESMIHFLKTKIRRYFMKDGEIKETSNIGVRG